MTITAPPTPTGGSSYTVDCSARIEDYVISVLSVEWVNITDRSITQPPQINGTVSANRSLTFNRIRTSNGGPYTCRASVNIPLANIIDRSNTAMEDIRAQSKFYIQSCRCVFLPLHDIVQYLLHLNKVLIILHLTHIFLLLQFLLQW